MATILIVDDEKSVRKTLSLLLEREGYDAVAAEGIEAARGLVSGADLVLLDIRLDDGNGLDFLEELNEQGFDKPVFLMSGMFNLSEWGRAVKLTGRPVINKPVESAGLMKLIAKTLGV